MKSVKAIWSDGKIIVAHEDVFGLVILNMARERGADFVRVTHFIPGAGGDPVHIADVYNVRPGYMPHGRYTQYYAVAPLRITTIGEAIFPAPENIIAGCARAILEGKNVHAAKAVLADVNPATWRTIFEETPNTNRWWEAIAEAMRQYNIGITPNVARYYVQNTKVFPVWP